MKPALLNSIYNKEQNFDSLRGLTDYYAKKMFVLYLNSLNKAGIDNLDQEITVTTKFPDGYEMHNTFKAGEHLMEALFDSEETKSEIQKLDQTFLENCQCPNKEDILNKLKFVLIEIGSQSVSQEEWTKELGAFGDCSDFEEVEEDF